MKGWNQSAPPFWRKSTEKWSETWLLKFVLQNKQNSFYALPTPNYWDQSQRKQKRQKKTAKNYHVPVSHERTITNITKPKQIIEQKYYTLSMPSTGFKFWKRFTKIFYSIRFNYLHPLAGNFCKEAVVGGQIKIYVLSAFLRLYVATKPQISCKCIWWSISFC